MQFTQQKLTSGDLFHSMEDFFPTLEAYALHFPSSIGIDARLETCKLSDYFLEHFD